MKVASATLIQFSNPYVLWFNFELCDDAVIFLLSYTCFISGQYSHNELILNILLSPPLRHGNKQFKAHTEDRNIHFLMGLLTGASPKYMNTLQTLMNLYFQKIPH